MEMDNENEYVEVSVIKHSETAPVPTPPVQENTKYINKAHRLRGIMTLLGIEILMLSVYYPILCIYQQACNTGGLIVEHYVAVIFMISFFVLILMVFLHVAVIQHFTSALYKAFKIGNFMLCLYITACGVLTFVSLITRNSEALQSAYLALTSVEKTHFSNEQARFEREFRLNTILIGIFYIVMLISVFIKALLMYNLDLKDYYEMHGEYKVTLDTFDRASRPRADLADVAQRLKKGGKLIKFIKLN